MKRISILAAAFVFGGLSLFAQIDRSKAPQAGPARELKMTTPQSFKLDNGLTVIVAENHKLPQVRVDLYLDYTPVTEGNKAGITSMVGELMRAGTASYSKEKLDEAIDFMGADLYASSRGGGFSTLKKHLDKTMGLFSEVILKPTFNNNEELTKLKKQALTGLEAEEKNPDAISGRVMNVLLYGKNHPYGEYVTKESIESIGMDDVKTFYNTYFKPGKAYLTFTGDITVAEATALAKQYFAGWAAGTAPDNPAAAMPAAGKTRIVLVDLPTSTQSVITIGNAVNYKKSNADYFAGVLGNSVLGGGSFGRLFNNIREDKGWTYGAYSSLNDDYNLMGTFEASAKVRNNVTDSAIVEFMNEIRRIRDTKPEAEELNIKKAEYTGMFALRLERPETGASFARTVLTEKLPADFYTNYLKNINAVTPEQVQSTMSKYLNVDNMVILVVGKAEEVGPALAKMGYPLEYADKFGNPISNPAEKKSAGDVTGTQIMQKYIAAIGGDKKLKKIKSISEKFSVSIAGAPVELDGTMKRMAPNKNMSEITMQGMPLMRRVFDGEKGSMSQMGQAKPMDEKELADAKAKTGLFEQMSYKPEQLKVDGIVTVNGKDAYKVIVTENGENSSEFYDVESGLLVKKESQSEGEDGKMITSVTEYPEYSETGGIKQPSKMVITAGEQVLTFTLKSRVFNKDVSALDFQ
ncbi:MAG: insulinase family protein [Bacteroidia bacterium]|nr:insulinase family protein [Bacteroidia bacterium]